MSQLASKHLITYPPRNPNTGPCLLPLLRPVRHCLHPLLSDTDAARLMRASHSTTIALLSDYRFNDHIFAYKWPLTVAQVSRSVALYVRYHMHILYMCLPQHWNEPLVDSENGRSLLPTSLIALALGDEGKRVGRLRVVHAALDRSNEEEVEMREGEERDAQLDRLTARWESDNHCRTWDVIKCDSSLGLFNQPIPPTILPSGLRHLQFNDYLNQPLQPGSIPHTVEVMQFGAAFNQPLEVGHLPASLTHLVFGSLYNQPLLPGALPVSLRRLYLGECFNQPLPPATLPPQLKGVCFGSEYNRPILPGAIPPSVTHIRLSSRFNQPLRHATLPHSLVHLNLGDSFDWPLLPSSVPSSLRELVVARYYKKALKPASLPDGLEVLAFHPLAVFSHPLQPGVLPASVRVVSMGERYNQQLIAGGIPATVRWLRLPAAYASKDLSGVLSPATRVVWWKRDE